MNYQLKQLKTECAAGAHKIHFVEKKKSRVNWYRNPLK